ncbi:MAG: hypothetical protein ABIH89_05755 [Elusimicrobiota bacterium]
MKKRKQYFIAKKFQTRIISRVVLLVAGAIIISGLLSYSLTIHMEKKSDFQLYGTTGGDLNKMIMVSSLFIVRPVIVRSLVIGGILGIIMAIISMLFYSHRLAGPIYSLERHLHELLKGKYEDKLVFRKKMNSGSLPTS